MKVGDFKRRLCGLVGVLGDKMSCAPQCICDLSNDMELWGNNLIPLESLEKMVEDFDKIRERERLWDDVMQAVRRSELVLRFMLEGMPEDKGMCLRIALKDCQRIIKEVEK